LYKAKTKQTFTDEEYEMLVHAINNAVFWKSRYAHLTESIRKLYVDERIGIIVDE
jgi:hypothetical protein